MLNDKPHPKQPKPSMRERVLDGAERLLSKGSAAFSMRELAEEAQVSFATPFNHFGNKAAIMLALSARRIASMHEQFARMTRLPETASARVLAAIDIAVSVMLAAPAVNRIVMAAISAPLENPGNVLTHSSSLWAEALGKGEGLVASTRALALARLPDQLAVAFRGVLSFWTAGEISDDALKPRARAAAAAVLLGFASRTESSDLLRLIEDANNLDNA